jgi:putative copper export protein
MLAPAWTTVRLSLHVLAATVWVGGQLTLAGLVPAVRPAGSETVRAVARPFSHLAWPAYAVLVGTGVWNVAAVGLSKQTGAWQSVLWAKVAVVAIAGLSAWLHQRAGSRAALACFGALSGLSALSALVLGVVLAG